MNNLIDRDIISRQAAIKELEHGKDKKARGEIGGFYNQIIENDIEKLKKLPSAQSDVVTASLEELINDYGEDGYFIIDGVNYQANELLNELKINSFVGEKFRKKIAKTIVQYFMKFGG